MTYLVIGGTASGKSAYAESIAVSLDRSQKTYIATMMPYDDECLKKIARHREMRKNKGFLTIESPTDLQQITNNSTKTVMLECISNLLANEMYRNDKIISDVAKHILNGIDSIINEFKNVIVVSNNIFNSHIKYDEDTEEYINSFGVINQEIAKKADVVVEIVCGLTIFHKGSELLK